VARVPLPSERGEPRKRKVFYGKTEAAVSAKLDAWHAEHPPRELNLSTRDVHLRNARELGTHTHKEWRAKVAALPLVAPYRVACYYCEEPVHIMQVEKDHYIPVSRGGSDGLDNLVATCRRCNRDKATLTGDEYLAYIGRRSWEGIA
jgi:5-methylcytosine-specific restriction endonuclease McrA